MDISRWREPPEHASHAATDPEGAAEKVERDLRARFVALEGSVRGAPAPLHSGTLPGCMAVFPGSPVACATG